MNKNELLTALQEYIDGLDVAPLVYLWDAYTAESNTMDDYIYSMDSFDEMHSDMKPWDIVRAAYYSGEFCPTDDWFWYDGYGNLVSSNNPAQDDNSPLDADSIVDYIMDNEDDLGDSDIRALLDELEDEENEE